MSLSHSVLDGYLLREGPVTSRYEVRHRARWWPLVSAVALGVLWALPPVGSAAGASGGQASGAASCPWAHSNAPVARKVREVMADMTEAEELSLVNGTYGDYVGNLPAVASLCIPALNLEDGPGGIGDSLDGGTQMPAPVAAASTWDTALEQQYGAVVGAEEAGKGANVDLGPTVNIVRDPRWGRAFESFGEDPSLAGQMASSYIRGVQSQGVMAQVKHYAVYNNETDRNTSADDDIVSARAEQEIYMPAFQAAVEAGVGSVMCAYSQPNGVPACQDHYLLSALDGQMGFQGFVTSDWGATHSAVASAIAGLDMDMPGNDGYYGVLLGKAVPHQVPRAYLDDMVARILRSMFTDGLIGSRPRGSLTVVVTTAAHRAVATRVAEEGTVLLKDAGHILPLRAGSLRSLALIGLPVTSGGGSAFVVPPSFVDVHAMRSQFAGHYRLSVTDGTSVAAAVAAARSSQVAVVFVGYQEAEATDVPTIGLGRQEDGLVAAVAAANEHTVVVLSTGSAVTMPWLGSVPGVLEQWYGGQETLPAIKAVLFGATDPSGRLPVSFPTSLSEVPASSPLEFPSTVPGASTKVEYNEGIDVGYRWYQRHDLKPLFPFGFGLSYTTFAFSGLAVKRFSPSGVATVKATVTNTGGRAGTEVAQLYVGDPPSTGEPPWQLKAFARVTLAPRASAPVEFHVPVHDLTYWDGHGWAAPTGHYRVAVGASAAGLALRGTLVLAHPVGGETVTVGGLKDQASVAGSPVSVRVDARDSQAGEALHYTAQPLPGGLSIDFRTGVISGVPLHAGRDPVTVTVTDANAVQASVTFTWSVTGSVAPPAPPSNNLPALVGGTAGLVVVLVGGTIWWVVRRKGRLYLSLRDLYWRSRSHSPLR